jgi:hypothetical protein
VRPACSSWNATSVRTGDMWAPRIDPDRGTRRRGAHFLERHCRSTPLARRSSRTAGGDPRGGNRSLLRTMVRRSTSDQLLILPVAAVE